MAQPKTEFSSVLPILKQALKNQKMTYAELAKGLHMSESGLKKIFNGEDCSFNKLSLISEVLGFSLLELLSEVRAQEPKQLIFTPEADEFLSAHFDYFEIYWKLFYERKSVEQIQLERKLSKKEMFKYLHKLDRLKLIEVGEGEKVKIPKAEFGYFQKSKLFVKMKKEWCRPVFDEAISDEPNPRKFFVFYYLKLTDASIQKLTMEFRDLIKSYTKETVQNVNLKNKDAKEYRMLTCIAPGSYTALR